jgi:hypothetical protein
MARGDFVIFEEAVSDLANGKHNLKDTHIFKLALVDDTLSPTAADASPAWGDYSANEVGTGGNYTAGGETLTYENGVTRWAEAGGVGTFDAEDISFAQNGSGFTDARWGILYNMAEGNPAIGFLDLGGDVSEVDGPVAIKWNASGIVTITAKPA